MVVRRDELPHCDCDLSLTSFFLALTTIVSLLPFSKLLTNLGAQNKLSHFSSGAAYAGTPLWLCTVSPTCELMSLASSRRTIFKTRCTSPSAHAVFVLLLFPMIGGDPPEVSTNKESDRASVFPLLRSRVSRGLCFSST